MAKTSSKDTKPAESGAGDTTVAKAGKKASAKKAAVKKTTSEKATAKKTASKKAVAKKAVAKKAPAKKASAKKAAAKKPAAARPRAAQPAERHVSSAERRAMIAEAAYLRGESQAFLTDEREDWLLAEAEVDARLARAGIVVRD